MPGSPILVLITFIVLKLTGVVSWPWVVVLIPLWVMVGIFLLCLALAACGIGLYAAVFGRPGSRRWL